MAEAVFEKVPLAQVHRMEPAGWSRAPGWDCAIGHVGRKNVRQASGFCQSALRGDTTHFCSRRNAHASIPLIRHQTLSWR